MKYTKYVFLLGFLFVSKIAFSQTSSETSNILGIWNFEGKERIVFFSEYVLYNNLQKDESFLLQYFIEENEIFLIGNGNTVKWVNIRFVNRDTIMFNNEIVGRREIEYFGYPDLNIPGVYRNTDNNSIESISFLENGNIRINFSDIIADSGSVIKGMFNIYSSSEKFRNYLLIYNSINLFQNNPVLIQIQNENRFNIFPYFGAGNGIFINE